MNRILPLEAHIMRAAHFAFCEADDVPYEAPRFSKRSGDDLRLYFLDVLSPTPTFTNIQRRELWVTVTLRDGSHHPVKLFFSNGRIVELDKWDEQHVMPADNSFHVDRIAMEWCDLPSEEQQG